MSDRTYVVRATWDDEAKVWVAVSDDVPGLVAEAAEIEILLKKLRVLILELLEANGVLPKRDHYRIEILQLLARYDEQLEIPA